MITRVLGKKIENGATVQEVVTEITSNMSTKEKVNLVMSMVCSVKIIKNVIILLLIIIILFVFLIIVPIFGDNILALMQSAKLFEGYTDTFIVFFNIIKWPVTLLIIYFNIKLIYTMAPSKLIQSKETTFGALFTTRMWALATVIFKFYITVNK